MDSLIKALLTAAMVALVLLAARRVGHRTAGMLAGLPWTTAPALGWIALGQGSRLASLTALGSLAGCALVPLFAIGYGRAAGRCSPGLALVAGVLAMTCGAPLASRMAPTLAAAVALCALSGVAAMLALSEATPRRATAAGDATATRRASTAPGLLACAALVGALSTLVATLASRTSPQFAGLLSGLPLLGLVAVMREHSTRGAACVTPFLRGYVVGTLGRALFAAVFAALARPLGATAAMVCGALVDVAFCVAAGGVEQWVALASRRPAGHQAATPAVGLNV